MGPHLGRCGNFADLPIASGANVLQWDRTSEGAEIQTVKTRAQFNLLLQWDRTSEGAEMIAKFLLGTGIVLLQWDRTSEGAEIADCFQTAIVRVVMLQWDRTSEGAEILPVKNEL